MRWLGSALDLLLPVRCAGCEAPPAALCPACLAAARPAVLSPLSRHPPPPLDWWTAALAYEGPVREALAQAKYRNARSALPLLAAILAGRLQAELPRPVDLLTWPPTTAARRRQRAFDQAEHLAREIGRALALPVAPSLARRAGPSQTGRSAVARRHGPAFGPAGAGVTGRRVLLVDDITTTGATLAAAARTLRAAGAVWVGGATVAHTPFRGLPGEGCGSFAACSSPPAGAPLLAMSRGLASGRKPPSGGAKHW